MKLNKAYVCYRASGVWEDYQEYMEEVFTTEEEAKAWVDRCDRELKEYLEETEGKTKYESKYWQSEREELEALQAKDRLTEEEQLTLEELSDLLTESANDYYEIPAYGYHTVISEEDDTNE